MQEQKHSAAHLAGKPDVGPLFYAEIPLERHGVQKNRQAIHYSGGKGARGSALWKATATPFITKGAHAKSDIRRLVLELQSRALRFCGDLPIRDPVHVVFHFIYPEREFYTVKNKVSRNLADQSNLYEMPQDCLQKAGIIEDDCQVAHHDGSRRLPGERHMLKIWIYKYEGEEMRPGFSPKKPKKSR